MTDSIWSKLAAPLDPLTIKTREEKRGGKTLVLRYIDSRTVADILDKHALGEWTLKVTPLPPRDNIDRDGAVKGIIYTMQASLTVNGITREDVGEGDDYKAASSDAFKRAAVRFGIGRELYGATSAGAATAATTSVSATPPKAAQGTAPATSPNDAPACPKCGGKDMWSNVEENRIRAAKGEKLRPDWKCKDRSCDGVLWPPKVKAAQAPKLKPGAEDDAEYLERMTKELDAEALPF
jgi:hypothetical protein